jgi:FkbM family methyltransferase
MKHDILADSFVQFAGVRTAFLLPQKANDHIQRIIAESGRFYEQDMLEHCRSSLQPGDVVVDGGAFIGNHTLFYANICEARVVAFEPNPESFNVLKANIVLNGVDDRVTAYQLGLGGESGRARLLAAVDANNQGMSSLQLARSGEVEVVRLDDVELPGPLRLLKVDVEGMEVSVLRGAAQTIQRDRPLLYVECASPISFGRVVHLMSGWGYAATAQFNATATVLFEPAPDMLQAVNTQISYLQYSINERLRAVSDQVARSTRSGPVVVSAPEPDPSIEIAERIQRLDDATRDVGVALGRLSAQLAHLHQKQGAMAKKLDTVISRQERSQRPVVETTIRKYRKLRRDPQRFIADSALAPVLTRSGGGPATRKVRKLLRDPESFFKDARSPIVGRVGMEALRRLGRRARSLEGARPIVADDTKLPTRSVVFALPEESYEPGTIAKLSRELNRTSEVIIVAGSSHALGVRELLAEIACDRARLYVFEDDESPARRLSYALERACGERIAVVLDPKAAGAADVSAALDRVSVTAGAGNRGSARVLRGSRPLVVAASRSELREILSGRGDPEVTRLLDGASSRTTSTGGPALFCYFPYQRARLIDRLAALRDEMPTCVVYGRHLARLETAIESAGSERFDHVVLVDPGTDDFFVYRSPSGRQPFRDTVACSAGIVCFERRPRWFVSVGQAVRKQSKRVSVIMTVYDAADTLGYAIDSILEQSYSNIELLIIDDCSQDGSFEVARRKASYDPRIRLLQTPRNGGTYCAKNLGLSRATGDVVTFHDSDDVALAHRLELQLGALLADPESVGNLVFHQRVTEAGETVWYRGNKDRPARISLMFRRQEVLDTVGYFDSVRVTADDELIHRLHAATGRPVRRLPSVAYVARYAPGSLTTAGAGTISIAADGTVTLPPARVEYWKAAQEWHRQIAQGQASAIVEFPLRRRPFSAPSAITPGRTEHRDQTVTASMATMPSRTAILEQTVASLLPQVDRLNIYLNNFESVPAFLNDPRIVIARSQEHGDQRDNGKFFFAERLAEGYHFTVDDDIVYPPDYVATTIAKIEQYDRRAAIGVHGLNLADPLESYTVGREMFHFKYAVERDQFVQLVGTGTLAYHTSTLRVSMADLKTTGMADLWFAIRAREHGVPLIVQARTKNWLRPIQHEGETIYDQTRIDDEKETAIVREHGPWSREAFARLHRDLAEYMARTRSLAGFAAAGGNVHQVAALLGRPPVRFAIIVAGWNCAEHVQACWESIEKQQPGLYDYEVYFVDDGSTDLTWTMLQQLPRSRNIHIRRNERNHGPAYTRYSVLRELEDGDQVCVLLDLDDLLRPNALSTLAETYLAHRDCWLTCGNWINQDKRRNPLDFYDEAVVQRRAYRDVPLFKCTHLRSFRRFLFDGLDEDSFKDPAGQWLMHCTDVALMLPLMEKCGPENILYIQEPLYVYYEQREAGTLRRFGKPQKVEMYRWLCSLPRSLPAANVNRPAG